MACQCSERLFLEQPLFQLIAEKVAVALNFFQSCDFSIAILNYLKLMNKQNLRSELLQKYKIEKVFELYSRPENPAPQPPLLIG